jgi:hypothetical protein
MLALAISISISISAEAASNNSTETDPVQVEATRALKAGLAKYAAGKYDGALADFTNAYRTFPSPKLFFNIAQCQLKLGHDLEAANAFQRFLSEAEETPALSASRAAANQELTTLAPHFALLHIQVEPHHTRVLEEGVLIEGASVFVAAGNHKLVASANDYYPEQRMFEVHAGEERTIEFKLKPVVIEDHRDVKTPTNPHRLPIIVGVAGGVALGGSIVVGVLASVSNGQLGDAVHGSNPNITPSQLSSLRSTTRTEAWISTGLLGGALIAGSAAVALEFWPARTESLGNTDVAPVSDRSQLELKFGVGPGGVVVMGRY